MKEKKCRAAGERTTRGERTTSADIAREEYLKAYLKSSVEDAITEGRLNAKREELLRLKALQETLESFMADVENRIAETEARPIDSFDFYSGLKSKTVDEDADSIVLIIIDGEDE